MGEFAARLSALIPPTKRWILPANVELNKLDLSKAEFVRDDVFKLLRTYRDRGEKFDVIVMDPPKLLRIKPLMGACRGYKDINMLAIQLLNEAVFS